MIIEQLILKDFRNYEMQAFQFSPTTNVLIGKNAQGKTNLIEAIYLLSLSKSFRTRSIQEMIRFEQPYARVLGKVRCKNRIKELEMVLFENGKQAKINGVKCSKSSEFVGNVNVVVFTPDDLFFVKGNPRNRRRFMDEELSKLSSVYLNYLNTYHHFLKERNQLLKMQCKDEVLLAIITEQMIEAEIEVAKRRNKFILQINQFAKKVYKKIAGNDEEIDLQYQTFFDVDTVTKESLMDFYDAHQERDCKYGMTHYGIHKDDLIVSINQKEASQFASQGQQRSIVLALKIALLHYIYQSIKEYPILLLDDVLSELDASRQTMLLDLVSEDIQTFITTTSLEGIEHDIIKKAKKIEINKERGR